MIQDLHSHTCYSFCAKNPSTEEGIIAAVQGGVELFGICDHQYGVGYATFEAFERGIVPTASLYQKRIDDYRKLLEGLKEKYREKIKLLAGLEIATAKINPGYPLPKEIDVSAFDYCLLEHIDREDSAIEGDLFSYAKGLRCPTGLAHTDLFAYLQKTGKDPLDYFRRMAEGNIFWELNVSYDSVHNFHEHEYVKRFFAEEWQQEIIKKSGVKLSVGFDGHIATEYDASRVRVANQKLRALSIPLVFDET